MNKRGQGLSTNAIILIILGVVVLVALIGGFALGWKNLAPWLGGGNNVDTIVTACGVASNTQSVYDFCTAKRELKAEDETLKSVTCYTLANADDLSKYGIEKASSINCKSSLNCGDWKYTKEGKEISVKVTIENEDKTEDYCTK